MKQYQEHPNDTFTHHGIHYYVNPLLLYASNIEPIKVNMSDIISNVKDINELDVDRVNKADTSYPLIAIKEKGIIYVLDGTHRLRKMYDQKFKTVMVKFVTQQQLEKCRVPKLFTVGIKKLK